MTTLTSRCIVKKSHYIDIATLWTCNISYTSDIVVAPIWTHVIGTCLGFYAVLAVLFGVLRRFSSISAILQRLTK
jgi:hypothetical protein